MHLCSPQRRNHPTPTQKPPNVTLCAIAVRLYACTSSALSDLSQRPPRPASGARFTIFHDCFRSPPLTLTLSRNPICSLSHVRIAFSSYCPYNTNQSTSILHLPRICLSHPSSSRLGRRLCVPLRSPQTQGSRPLWRTHLVSSHVSPLLTPSSSVPSNRVICSRAGKERGERW